MGRYMVLKNNREISNHNTKANAVKSRDKHGGYIQYHVGKTEAQAMNRPRSRRKRKW